MLVMAALAICAITAALLRPRTDDRAEPRQPRPAATGEPGLAWGGMDSFPSPAIRSDRLDLREFDADDLGLASEVAAAGEREALPPGVPAIPRMAPMAPLRPNA